MMSLWLKVFMERQGFLKVEELLFPPLQHDAIYAYLLNHVNVYILDGSLWEKRLVAGARPNASWRMRTTGQRCVVHGCVPAARRLSCGHIKYHILRHQKTRSRHSKCAPT